MDIDATIATPNWEACKTCQNFDDNECCYIEIELELHLGDFILCKQYENNQEINEDA